MKSLGRVRLLATPWTAAYQGPLSMGFARQEYWSGLPLPLESLNSIQNALGTCHLKTIQHKNHFQGLRWWCSGWGSTFAMQGTQV